MKTLAYIAFSLLLTGCSVSLRSCRPDTYVEFFSHSVELLQKGDYKAYAHLYDIDADSVFYDLVASSVQQNYEREKAVYGELQRIQITEIQPINDSVAEFYVVEHYSNGDSLLTSHTLVKHSNDDVRFVLPM